MTNEQPTPLPSAEDIVSELRLAKQSEAGYRAIAMEIVHISAAYLTEQGQKKAALRGRFMRFFPALLIAQLALIGVLILADCITVLPVEVSGSVMNTFIVSVFVETLGVVGAMVAFAFASTEESAIVKTLNNVIENYQKYARIPENPEADTYPTENIH